MVSDELQAVLQGLRFPALILSQSRTIVAVNDGICRLSGRPSHDSLVGHEIEKLGFVSLPNGHSQDQNWDPLFQACVFDQDRPTTSRRNDHASSADKPRESCAEDFWDDEEGRISTAVNVVITRSESASAAAAKHDVSRIRARMSIQCLRLDGDSAYIVTFHRPVLHQPSSNIQPLDKAADNEHTGSNHSDDKISLPEDGTDRETQVHRLVSTAIPYFTALFDSDGQAVHFSTSWYRVTGMTKEETLGKGWFQAVHADDRQAIMDGFARMVRHREDSWTWEARYSKKDGTYQWFLVRVESSKKEFGNVNYWYGSMMDVNILLRTKQESENRRKSIMALVSQTGVRMWGLKKDRSLLFQEGSLSWHPTAALSRQPRRKASEDYHLMTPGASTSVDRVSNAIKAIFDGKLTTSTLEHKEDDRWYRSTLIADLQGHIDHQSSSQATQAVLGLTIDITDVRARAELEAQNESLVEKERAAKEATELKSRFVANVRVLRCLSFSVALSNNDRSRTN